MWIVEADSKFVNGVCTQSVDGDESYQGSFCASVFEGMAEDHST